jgi:hypothetical protein
MIDFITIYICLGFIVTGITYIFCSDLPEQALFIVFIFWPWYAVAGTGFVVSKLVVFTLRPIKNLKEKLASK